MKLQFENRFDGKIDSDLNLKVKTHLFRSMLPTTATVYNESKPFNFSEKAHKYTLL